MSHLEELGGDLLASVSRSFYLTIRFLPRELRAPITLAYLLARASDTIADEAKAPAKLRLELLEAFERSLTGDLKIDALSRLPLAICPDLPGERILLEKVKQCMLWLEEIGAADKAEIVDVLEKIIRGQMLDIVRFENVSDMQGLQSAADLDEYTYLVAGCVGEFWTRLCYQHLPGYSKESQETMVKLGINFGKGLQLVNVLRDLPADFRAGRCYLPRAELDALGLTSEMLLQSPQVARPIFYRWLGRAKGHLEDGFRYIRGVRNARVRFACILPWHIGMKTLALLENQPSLEAPRRVKVTRWDVYRTMAAAPFAAFSDHLLDEIRAAIPWRERSSSAWR